jgi:hypothetical protein
LELTDHSYYTLYLKREFKRFENEAPTRALIKKRYLKGKKLLESGMGGLETNLLLGFCLNNS